MLVVPTVDHRLTWPDGIMALGEARLDSLGDQRNDALAQTDLLDIATNAVGEGFWSVVLGLPD